MPLLTRRSLLHPLAVLLLLLMAVSAFAQDPPEFRDALVRANDHMGRREYDDALKLFKQANGMKQERCPECLWGMAQAYSRMGADKNVIEVSEKLLALPDLDPKYKTGALNVKGLALASQGRQKNDPGKLQQAESAFREALESSGAEPVIRFNLGWTLLRMGKDAEGSAELKQYLEQQPRGQFAKQASQMMENPRRAREDFAPDLSFTSADGEYLTLEDFKGKVVVLDFWGTWCGPCVAAVPALRNLTRKFEKDPFALISIAVENDEAAWRAFLAKNQMTWPQALDSRRLISRDFRISLFPSYLVLDHEGIIRARLFGGGLRTEGDLADAVKRALKALPRGDSK